MVKTHLIALLLCCSAHYSLAQTNEESYPLISLDIGNTTIENAINEIEKRTNWRFLYNSDQINTKKTVYIKIKRETIQNVLDILFDTSDIDYTINNNQIVLKKGKAKNVKSKNISGVVLDENKQTLIGATVFLKGTNIGTTTNLEGQFTLNAEPSSSNIIVVTYIGYMTQEAAVNNKTNFKITLKKDFELLDEVVVVGYGVMKRSDLTGAVSSVKTKDLPLSSNTSIAHMLSGKAAGVTIRQTSAQPGGGVEMLIRGGASTGAGNEPLYIIDGFPVGGSAIEPASDNRYSDFGSRNPLNSINPNDIESIEILKDASSSAIYGARAANGVVIITTKRGSGDKTQVSYSASYGIQRIANKTEMLNAEEWMIEANKFSREEWMFDNSVYPYGDQTTSNIPKQWNPIYSESDINGAGVGTNWYDLITQDGSIHQQNISISGGSKDIKYLVSFNYFDQIGVVENAGFTRYTGRVNIDHKLNNIFSYGLNATQSFITNTNIPLGNEDFENAGLINSAMSYDPTVELKDKQGNYIVSPLMSNVPNPVSMLDITDYTKTNRLLVSAYVQAEITKGLIAKVNVGIDSQLGRRNSYIPKTTLYGKQEGGKASQSVATQFDRLIETTLNYNFNIKSKHKFNMLLGYSFQDFVSDGVMAANSQFFTDAFLYNSLITGETKRPMVTSSKSREVLMSYFGRINYNFDDKYLVTFTLRADGSNKFGSNNRYGIFPSGAVAWRINQENWLKDVNWLNDLKLRLSFGQTGNSAIGNNAYEYYSAAWHRYVFGDAVNVGTMKNQMANPNLKWETTTEFNIGLDFGFFEGNRLSGSMEVFSKQVSDLLGFKTLKSFMEVSTVAANIGTTKSSGIEITLRSRNLTGEFKWDSDLNFTRYVDRWKERDPESNLDPWQQNDDPIRAIYGYLDDGIMGADEIAPEHMPLLRPGQFKVKDLNGYLRDESGNLIPDANGDVQYSGSPDGIIDQADIVMLGTTDPGFSIGFGNTFQYKGFDLNIFFYGMFDRMVNNHTRSRFSVPEMRRILTGQNFMTEVKDRWSSENTTASLPSGFTTTYPQPGNYLWEDGWFIRCKNITLGYSLPQRWFGEALSKMRVFVDLGNLFVITPYTGNDPETDFKAGYPNQRTYMFGLDVQF